jgi:hypothetical protein
VTAKRSLPKTVQEFTEHDLKELARFVRRYGRKKVAAKLKTIEPPARQGRPRKDPDERHEFEEDIAEAIWRWVGEHHKTGSKKPVEDALIDLYEVLAPKQPYTRWRKTALRKRSNVRREVEARLNEALESATRIAAYKAAIKKESAK